MRSEREFHAVRFIINKESIKIVGKDKELFLSLSEIRRVGLEKRFNKVLALLVVVMAVISLVTLNTIYLLLTFIMLTVTGLSREYVLIIECSNEVIKVKGLRKTELNKALSFFKEYFTH